MIKKMNNPTRDLIPGSEWLYFKLYTGTKSADILLINKIYPLITELKKQHLITEFFFIRYTDPHFHLRVRLHLPDQRMFTEILTAFYESFKTDLENGLLWNIQLDTYKREIERYGYNTIEAAESIFCMDSDIIIQLIKNFSHPEGDFHRWLAGLVLIDDILSAANYNQEAKENLLSSLSRNFKREFHFTTSDYLQQLSKKYREYRVTISEILNQRYDSPVKSYTPYLDERRNQMKPYLDNIILLNNKNVPVIQPDHLLSSIIHMTMNRLFCSQNRFYEMVIYDLLYRHYNSANARVRQKI